ncbi:MAG: response regulator, partial [Deltaproteobacteria bacterium]
MTTDSGDAARILVVDDERVIREILAEFLSLEGFSVHTVEDGEKALTELRLKPYDLLITDLKMPRLSGLQLLERIETERLGVLTVLMTGFGTVETAIEAMKKGAYDYLLKPFKVEEVIHVVRRALYRQRLQAENIRLREALTIYRVSEAIALSRDIDHVLDVVLRAAIDEVKADVATLHLRDVRSGSYEERAARAVLAGRAGPGPRRQGRPVLHRGARAGRARVIPVRAAPRPQQSRRRAQRVLVHLGQEVRRGPPQDALGARVARRQRDRQRAPDGRAPGVQRQPDPRQPLARGDVPADRRRLRPGARGERPVHPRPLRARRRVLRDPGARPRPARGRGPPHRPGRRD